MSIISDDEWNKHVESIADLHDQSPTEDTPTVLQAAVANNIYMMIGIHLKTGDWDMSPLEFVPDVADHIIKAAQLQLVSELEGELNNHALANTVDKDNHAWLVRDVLEVLEHKKQELERGE